LRDGAAIGALSLSSWEVSGFSDSQVELLQTFAEQAVIAIGSAETSRELRHAPQLWRRGTVNSVNESNSNRRLSTF
jgi:GAF domain-containing protein